MSGPNDIGFTFAEEGEMTLPNGKVVPRLVGRPNNPEAHRRFIQRVRESLAAEENAGD